MALHIKSFLIKFILEKPGKLSSTCYCYKKWPCKSKFQQSKLEIIYYNVVWSNNVYHYWFTISITIDTEQHKTNEVQIYGCLPIRNPDEYSLKYSDPNEYSLKYSDLNEYIHWNAVIWMNIHWKYSDPNKYSLKYSDPNEYSLKYSDPNEY